VIEKSATSKLICYQHPNEAHNLTMSRFALKLNSNDLNPSYNNKNLQYIHGSDITLS